MELSVNHLASVIACALRIALERHPYISTMCGEFWKKNLRGRSLEVLKKKLFFLLLHCSLETIKDLYEKGLFKNKRVMMIVGEVIKRKALASDPDSREMMRYYDECRGK